MEEEEEEVVKSHIKINKALNYNKKWIFNSKSNNNNHHHYYNYNNNSNKGKNRLQVISNQI